MAIEDDYFIVKINFKDKQYLKAGMLPNAVAEHQPVNFGLIESNQPLEFSNNAKEDFINNNHQEILRDIIPASTSFIVKEPVKKSLEQFNIANLQFYPAIYRDLNNKVHSYWYLNFYEKLDCWCRKNSVYNREKYLTRKDRKHFAGVSISKYALDLQIITALPQNKNIFFKMAKSSPSDVFIHKAVLKELTEFDLHGVQFFKVSEYTRGMEF